MQLKSLDKQLSRFTEITLPDMLKLHITILILKYPWKFSSSTLSFMLFLDHSYFENVSLLQQIDSYKTIIKSPITLFISSQHQIRPPIPLVYYFFWINRATFSHQSMRCLLSKLSSVEEDLLRLCLGSPFQVKSASDI